MFGKIRSMFWKEQGSKPSEPAGSVSSIVVSAEALKNVASEPGALVYSVVDFVNAMLQQGRYRVDELPAEAMQAYQCDYYLAQILNGGHSQYIHNSRQYQGNYELTSAGLAAMGAAEYAGIFQEMQEWMLENPVEAKSQTGFTGGRAEALDSLDRRFYALNTTTPMLEVSGSWIASLKHLRAVSEADLPRVYAEMAALNPHLNARQMAARVGQIRHFLSDTMLLGFGYAANVGETARPVVAIGNGAYYDVQGQQKMAFVVNAVSRTNYFGVLDDEGAALYERIEHENPKAPAMDDSEGWKKANADGFFSKFKPPEVGAKVAHVTNAQIEAAAELCASFDAAAAVDLLLRSLNPDPGLTYASFDTSVEHDAQTVVILTVLTDREVLNAYIRSDGAMLFRGREVLAKVGRAQIREHAAFVNS